MNEATNKFLGKNVEGGLVESAEFGPQRELYRWDIKVVAPHGKVTFCRKHKVRSRVRLTVGVSVRDIVAPHGT